MVERGDFCGAKKDEKVFVRGLIEISNYCYWDCLYCGLRRSNQKLKRYALTEEEIVSVAGQINDLGIKTIVLQSGDNKVYSRSQLIRIIKKIKKLNPHLAITLSLGERSFDDYRAFLQAGAERYLLKQEVMDERLYKKLHPGQSLKRRLKILEFLKKVNYQVGCGFIVGLPQERIDEAERNLKFMQDFSPAMAAIGPFVPAVSTPLACYSSPALERVLEVISFARQLLPASFLPATTALNSLSPSGYEQALRCGCNVLMPNFTPCPQLRLYKIYRRKDFLSWQKAKLIVKRAKKELSLARGDYQGFN